MKKPFKVFRWKAIGPLLLVLALLVVIWMIFGDRLVQDTSEEASTELLGTEVDISGLKLHETAARVNVARVQIADPFDRQKNLVETGALELELDPAALLEKKLVVNQLRVTDLTFGTRRETPAAPAASHGYAATMLSRVRQWSSQFTVPLLQLTPIDTIKQLVLDPNQLSTVKQTRAVLAAADSIKNAFARNFAALDIRPTIDSARALAERLTGANPASLGLAGTRAAVQSVRRTLQELDSTRDRISQLERSGEAGISLLRRGVESVDQARQDDYAFARGLLQLPSFAAPDIGAALFGPVSIDRFQQAVYWAELARKHLPPGLQPRTRAGLKRLRMDGTTVEFPRERDYPSFLLRQGSLNVSFTAFGGKHTLAAAITGLTSQPTLYGHPATVVSRGTIGGAHPMRLQAGAVINHVGAIPVDSVQASLDGVPLPGFRLPGLPFRVDPGTGLSRLDFTLRGDQVKAQWSLRSTAATWQLDSAAATSLGMVQQLIWRVVSGLRQLDVTAELSGNLRSPRFSVHSNIDEAIAERIHAVLGEEVQKAEEKVKAEVDRLVMEKVAEARAQVAGVSAEVADQVTRARQEVDSVKGQLEGRLKALTGLGGVIGLPR